MFRMPEDDGGNPVPILSPTTAQVITMSGSSVQSAAFTQKVIRFTPTATCFFLVGADPTATSSTHYAAANMPYPEIPVSPGDKIAFLGTGTVYISELS